jgi:nitrite reductase (NADH) large subunit
MRIGIIGAGHAGVEAARVACEQGAEVVLFSSEDVMPYYRPRLVALAFGQADFAAIQLKPEAWYREQGIDLRLNAAVTALDPQTLTVTARGQQERFDGLILACGALPVMPGFMQTGEGRIWPLWNHGHAVAIRRGVKAGAHLVVVGGGILGIEAALRALDAGMQVTIVELMERLMPAQFGIRASAMLFRRLRERGITILLGQGVVSSRVENDRLLLDLNQGRSLMADVCLVSVGARPDKGLAQACGLPVERGMVVDRRLRTSVPSCMAAGDVIQFNGITRCSMKEASTQGRVAACNLIAAARGGTGDAYQPETLPLMFRARDFEIYAIGEVGGQGYEEHLLEGSAERTIRSLVMRDGIPLGVQMVGTREGFDDYASAVKKATAINAATGAGRS